MDYYEWCAIISDGFLEQKYVCLFILNEYVDIWVLMKHVCVHLFQHVDTWSFNVFALNDSSGDHALKFVFYELLTRYDLINRFKVCCKNDIMFHHTCISTKYKLLSLLTSLILINGEKDLLFLCTFHYFQVPISALISFVESLEVGYSKHKNPYHNLMHAADVTQTIHYLLLKTGIVVSCINQSCVWLMQILLFSSGRKSCRLTPSWTPLKRKRWV